MKATKNIKSTNKNNYMKIIQCINSINEKTLSDGKKLNNGTYYENIFIYNMDNILITIETQVIRDNKNFYKFGDYRKGNLIYQVKSINSELHIIKMLIEKYNIKIENKEQLIDLYIKYNKANRYVYTITYNNSTYAIVMNAKQFKQFAMQFGRYSNSRKNIRFFVAESTIIKWLNI